MSADLINISNAAQDVSNTARELHAMTRAMGLTRTKFLDGVLSDRREELEIEFRQLADALGYDVVKREASALLAAE